MIPTSLPPLSLYVHIPWCVKKCLYCDFNSHPLRSDVSPENYTESIIKDLMQYRHTLQDREIQTVFFGGGTPSVFEPALIARIIDYVKDNFSIKDDAEITLEANPGVSDSARFEGYRTAGVNRLSIGVQTTNDEILKKLGRAHSSKEALVAVQEAKLIFDNINVDLMFALPGQTLDELHLDLLRILDFNLNHLSIYQLTLEPNTWFYKHPPKLPDDDLAAEMQSDIESVARAHGYKQYEVSAFAGPGKRCQHNMNYWEFGDYLGVGAGAHSKLSCFENSTRLVKHKQPKRYMESIESGDGVFTNRAIQYESLPFEFFMNALRLLDGVPMSLFQKRTLVPIIEVKPKLMSLVDRGLLTVSKDVICTTPLGLRFLNEVLQDFL